MITRLNTDDFVAKIHAGVPVVDVRSPGEFAAGRIPDAHSIPLFSNEERAAVGTLYKHEGRQPAIERGLEFVGPKMADMAREACRLAGPRREILVYCWRGGMRSGSVAWLFGQMGLRVGVLEGGYKAYRHRGRELMDRMSDLRILGGNTGSGKTEILKKMAADGHQVIDLEGLASHRGSAFGSLGEGSQVSTEHFENLIAEHLHRFDLDAPIWTEAESRNIGRIMIPDLFFEMMNRSKLYHVTIPFDVRLDRIMVDYGCFSAAELTESMEKIRKRIGFDRHKEAIEAIAAGDIRRAAAIALEYYDKGYELSLKKRGERVEFDFENYDRDLIIDALIADKLHVE